MRQTLGLGADWLKSKQNHIRARAGLALPSFPEHAVSVRYATEHRCGVAVRGPRLSDAITGTDPLKDGRPLQVARPPAPHPDQTPHPPPPLRSPGAMHPARQGRGCASDLRTACLSRLCCPIFARRSLSACALSARIRTLEAFSLWLVLRTSKLASRGVGCMRCVL
jgi:hypothetical protein